MLEGTDEGREEEDTTVYSPEADFMHVCFKLESLKYTQISCCAIFVFPSDAIVLEEWLNS